MDPPCASNQFGVAGAGGAPTPLPLKGLPGATAKQAEFIVRYPLCAGDGVNGMRCGRCSEFSFLYGVVQRGPATAAVISSYLVAKTRPGGADSSCRLPQVPAGLVAVARRIAAALLARLLRRWGARFCGRGGTTRYRSARRA